MGNIFEALQRLEAERSGERTSLFSEATELLQRAERQAISQWKAESLREPGAAEPGENGFSFESEGTAADSEMTDASVAEVLQAEEGRAIFSQFRPLRISHSRQGSLVCLANVESPAAEAFRLLGVRLRHMRRDRTLRKLLVTSTVPQEGKSLLAANLACTFASGSQDRVLLLEGDLRLPSQSKIFGLEEIPGICEWLRGERSLTESIYHLEDPNIWILPAGNASGKPLELMQSQKLAALVDHLATWFDWIIIDSPPVLPLADTSMWARMADGILVVARNGITEKRHLERGIQALDSGKLIGAVMNSTTSTMDGSYYYYRRHSGSSSPESARGA